MRYVSPKYERQLADLAEHLRRPIGGSALQDTVEIEAVPSVHPNLKLCDPVENGWEFTPPEAA